MTGPASRRRLCVVVTNRASYARIKSVLHAAQMHDGIELQLVLSASMLLQRFGKAEAVVRADGFEPAATVHCIIEGESPAAMAKTTGLAVMELSSVFEYLKPDIVLTVADRFETLATAVAASYMNIPLAHTQGGEVTGSIDESVRHAVTKLAHLHFPATDNAGANIIRMGEAPETVHVTGCPSIDLLHGAALDAPDQSLMERYGVGQSVNLDRPYLLVMQHSVTTEFDRAGDQVAETLKAVHESGVQAIWMWPNVDSGSDAISKCLRSFRERVPQAPIHFFRNLPPVEFARLIKHAACMVGNSSSALREAAYLGTPSINIGTRQANRERAGNVVDVPHDSAAILSAIRSQMARGSYERSLLFGDGRAGERIVNILAGAQVQVQKRLHYPLLTS